MVQQQAITGSRLSGNARHLALKGGFARLYKVDRSN